MRYKKLFAWCALAAGVALPGASALSAQSWNWPNNYRDTYYDRQDFHRQELRSDYRDMRRDYDRMDRMRADIARDRARLNEAIRCGRGAEAAEMARDLARDQQAFNAQYRDIQRDRIGAYPDAYPDAYRDRR